jgi:hypothetical protein
LFLAGFPLLIIPLAIYNMVVFLMPGVPWTDKVPGTAVRLPSQAEWAVTYGDVLIFIALFLLFVEVLKASRAAGKPVLDHLLSVAVFVAMIAELLLVDRAATSTFAVITAISLVEVAAGTVLPRRVARRPRGIEPQVVRG